MKTQMNTNLKTTWMNYSMIYDGGIPVITRNLPGFFTGVSIPSRAEPEAHLLRGGGGAGAVAVDGRRVEGRVHQLLVGHLG